MEIQETDNQIVPILENPQTENLTMIAETYNDQIFPDIRQYLPNPYAGLTEKQIYRLNTRYLYMDIRYILNSAGVRPRKIFALFKVDSSFTLYSIIHCREVYFLKEVESMLLKLGQISLIFNKVDLNYNLSREIIKYGKHLLSMEKDLIRLKNGVKEVALITLIDDIRHCRKEKLAIQYVDAEENVDAEEKNIQTKSPCSLNDDINYIIKLAGFRLPMIFAFFKLTYSFTLFTIIECKEVDFALEVKSTLLKLGPIHLIYKAIDADPDCFEKIKELGKDLFTLEKDIMKLKEGVEKQTLQNLVVSILSGRLT